MPNARSKNAARERLSKEGGVKDGRKPLEPHLIEDHKVESDVVYDASFDANVRLHEQFHP